MDENKFAVLILTHGRAERVITYDKLRQQGYTGKIYLIIDDEDEQKDAYFKKFGEQVIMFSKSESAAHVDTADNLNKRNVVVFARNECHRIAGELGLTHFLELDDDYSAFMFRRIEGKKMTHHMCKNLDRLFSDMCEFLDTSGALTIAFAQGGDFIGGANSGTFKKKVLRKAMNTFFCRTDRPFQFYGRINEDTTMYCLLGNQGHKIFTVTDVMVTQGMTQQNAGGLTDIYLDLGTYVKSFYTVMYCPQAVKVQEMGASHKRLHHNIAWNFCVPKILNQKWRKENSNT